MSAGQAGAQPNPSIAPAQTCQALHLLTGSLVHPPSPRSTCCGSLLRVAPTVTALHHPAHPMAQPATHHANPLSHSFKRPASCCRMWAPAAGLGLSPSAPHRLRPTLSLLRRGHRTGPREGLVEAAQDLLPHRGAQLVRDVRHLHDPAQQWRAGTLLGIQGGQGGMKEKG